jgi:hypothetical protein
MEESEEMIKVNLLHIEKGKKWAWVTEDGKVIQEFSKEDAKGMDPVEQCRKYGTVINNDK